MNEQYVTPAKHFSQAEDQPGWQRSQAAPWVRNALYTIIQVGALAADLRCCKNGYCQGDPMDSTTRRTFIIQLATAGSALASAGAATAATPGLVDEKDPQAAAMGYVADTTKADGKKYPKHTNDQKCGGCQLFAGKAGDAAGPCPIFAGKQVSATGWCSSFMKKVG
jgi:hypothetical protein